MYNFVKTNASKTRLIFSEICCRGHRKGVINALKALSKKIEEFCKNKNLALSRRCQSKLPDQEESKYT